MWVVMSDSWGIGRGLDVSGQNLTKIEATIREANQFDGDGIERLIRGTFLGDDTETEVDVTGLPGLRLISE